MATEASISTRVDFAGKSFASPLVAVAGTAGYLSDVAALRHVGVDINAWGGMIFKSITPKKRSGAPSPRICECQTGLINAVGLQNDGIDHFLRVHLPAAAPMPVQKIASLAAFTTADFVYMVEKLVARPEIDLLELNISCPNVDYHDKHFASDNGLVRELLTACVAVKQAKPLMVKLSPHVASMAEMALLCQNHGADALSIANTYKGLKINIHTQKPFIKNVIGGYSGLGIKPITLALVYEAAQVVDIPILGVGGVSSYADVVEYLLAGARLVGIGTMAMMQPSSVPAMLQGLKKYLHRYNVTLDELTHALRKA